MSLQQLPITSGGWLCCFLWTSWYYFSAMKMGLGLSSSSLKLPLLEAMCFFTIDVSTLLSSTPRLWGMTDTKNFKACYWKGSNPSKGKYFALNLFFFTGGQIHEKYQQQCNYRWLAHALALTHRCHLEDCEVAQKIAFFMLLNITCMQISGAWESSNHWLLGMHYGS